MIKVIRDLRTLNAIGRKYGLKFDREYRYYTNSTADVEISGIEYNGKRYRLKYFDGCFCPYIVEV